MTQRLSMFDTDRITGDLQGLLQMSKPGDTLHRLVLAELKTNALGVPDLPFGVFLIDCVYGPNHPAADEPEVFIAKTIVAAAGQMLTRGARLYLAALFLETNVVVGWDEAAENRARRMRADHQLGRHEDAQEVTILYAADRDGRRYGATKWHTGPFAGQTTGVAVADRGRRLGGPQDLANDDDQFARLIRRAVDLPW